MDVGNEDEDDSAPGEQFKPAEGTSHELGARVSKFPGLLPGEVAKRFKAAVIGKKGAHLDESDDEEDSPVTDAHVSGAEIESRHDIHLSNALEGGTLVGRDNSANDRIAAGRHRDLRNYNTFGWESDTDRMRTSSSQAPTL